MERMDTETLAQLIDRKHVLLTQLRELAVKQAELVDAGSLSPMMSLLAVKQRLLKCVEQLETELDPFRQQDPDRRVWRSPEHRERARVVSTHCDELLQQIMSLEKDCESRMARRRDEAAERLQTVHTSSHAATAYSSVLGESAAQFDASCES